MTIDDFWALIAESRTGSMDRQFADLVNRLAKLPPNEIIEYRDHFESLMDAAYDYDLWAVAYIMGEGCSDDWFAYFRAWLISLGREQYDTALQNPEAVPAILSATRAEDIFFEKFTYAARDAYFKVTHSRIPDPAYPGKLALTGRNWTDDSELKKRYPALWKRYMED